MLGPRALPYVPRYRSPPRGGRLREHGALGASPDFSPGFCALIDDIVYMLTFGFGIAVIRALAACSLRGQTGCPTVLVRPSSWPHAPRPATSGRRFAGSSTRCRSSPSSFSTTCSQRPSALPPCFSPALAAGASLGGRRLAAPVAASQHAGGLLQQCLVDLGALANRSLAADTRAGLGCPLYGRYASEVTQPAWPFLPDYGSRLRHVASAPVASFGV